MEGGTTQAIFLDCHWKSREILVGTKIICLYCNSYKVTSLCFKIYQKSLLYKTTIALSKRQQPLYMVQGQASHSQDISCLPLLDVLGRALLDYPWEPSPVYPAMSKEKG